MAGLWSFSERRDSRPARKVRLLVEILEDRTQPSTCTLGMPDDPPPFCEPSDLEQVCTIPDEVAVVSDAVFLQFTAGARPITAHATDTSPIPFTTSGPLDTQLYLQYKAQSLGVTFDAPIDTGSIVPGTNLRLERSAGGHWSIEPTEWTAIDFSYRYDATVNRLTVFLPDSALFTIGTYRLVVDGDASSGTPLLSADATGGPGVPVGTDETHPNGQAFHLLLYTLGEDYRPPDDSKHDLAPVAAPDLVAILIVPSIPANGSGTSDAVTAPGGANSATSGNSSALPTGPVVGPVAVIVPVSPIHPIAPLPTFAVLPVPRSTRPAPPAPNSSSVSPGETPASPPRLNLIGYSAAPSTNGVTPNLATAAPSITATALNLGSAPLGGERGVSAVPGISGERLDLTLAFRNERPDTTGNLVTVAWPTLPAWIFTWLDRVLGLPVTTVPDEEMNEDASPEETAKASGSEKDATPAALALAAVAVVPTPHRRRKKSRRDRRRSGRG